MFIEKSMTRKAITVEEDASIVDARDRMVKNRIRHLPVLDADNNLVGIITDRDIRSALPSPFATDCDIEQARDRASRLKVKEVMTRDPITISPAHTLEDALLLMHDKRVGALPVVDQEGKLRGIISTRDIMQSFIDVLGIEEPGTLLGILVENKLGQMKRVVDAISEERIPFGSILAARHWEEEKRAIFPYLLTNNVARVKKKLEEMGFTLINPLEWTLEHTPKTTEGQCHKTH